VFGFERVPITRDLLGNTHVIRATTTATTATTTIG
jgi:hypothetical protein